MPPIPRRYRLIVVREQYKFSCAHMTVFPDGSKERLHGHNYQVGLTLELSDVRFENMIPFAELKSELSQLCTDWKERVLLPMNNPRFELVHQDPHEIEFRLCGARYVLPALDALLLPTDNISAESLADLVASRLLAGAPSLWARDHVLGFEVTIHEHPGQGAACVVPLR